MPRAMKKPKRPRGNPPLPIDWNIVDKYLLSGCKGTEIAPHFGICEDTLYARCEEEKGLLWSAYSAKKRAQGDSILRDVQFNRACDGSDTMLIWLGKVRLEQKETAQTITIPPEHQQSFNSLMEQFREMQERNKLEASVKDSITPTESNG
jgi:hypothetical protein